MILYWNLHYTSVFREFESGKWLLFDDSRVRVFDDWKQLLYELIKGNT